ncbi:MAG: hypothetical protein BGO68_02980 [Candidatus Amoebophilus sp. 36-38]|nr:MAG: hypothetical protein BGO68_02980 [Candidatus Amoebophilus sp. 36-38]
MIAYQNYKFSFVTLLVSMILLNSCDNCRNATKSDRLKQTPKGKEEFLDNEPEIPTKNKGIINIGNSCYMNSVIQILASFYQKPFEKKKETPLAKAANDIINAITDKEEVTPAEIRKKATDFFNALKKPEQEGGIDWKPKCGSQEDAAELIGKIFDWLDMPKAETNYKLIHPTTHAERWKTGTDLWSIWQLPMEKNQVKNMQTLFDNSLPSGNPIDINWTGHDANDVTATEIPRLKNLNQLYGKMLIISPKRFEFDNTDNTASKKTASKITTKITAPFTLTIKKEQTADLSQDLLYELVGFIRHSGDVGGGHYVTYTQVDSKWILYDDSSVSEVPVGQIQSPAEQAYLFFYKQVP